MIQHVQGEILHMCEDVQAVFGQLNDLSFKFSTMMAEWQQQRGQSEMHLKPLRIEVPRFEDGNPQGWIFKIQ